MTTTTLTTLHARLAELNISPAELAKIVHRDESEVEDWLTADPLPEDAQTLTRFLATDVDALRRVEFLRRRHTLTPDRKDGVVMSGYAGGYEGIDGSAPA